WVTQTVYFLARHCPCFLGPAGANASPVGARPVQRCDHRCHRFTLWVPHHFLDALRSCQRLGGEEISSLGFSTARHAPSAGSGLSKKQQLTWLSSNPRLH